VPSPPAEFDTSRINRKMYNHIKSTYVDKPIDMKKVMNATQACAPLVIWVRAQLRHREQLWSTSASIRNSKPRSLPRSKRKVAMSRT